jgi:signal transduction histidine kinase
MAGRHSGTEQDPIGPVAQGAAAAGGQAEEEIARLRAELQASEARFQSIIERNADGIIIVDAEGRVRFLNPAAEELFGRTAAELLGQDFGIATLPGETTEIDVVGRGSTEGRIAELRVTATTWEGGPAQLIALRDITDRRRSEERARRLARERAARAHAEQEVRRAQFLAEAASVLDASLDPEVTLRHLSQLLVPRFADWCVIDLLQGEDIQRVAAVHTRSELHDTLEALRREYPPRQDERQPGGRVIRSGEPELHRGADAALIHAVALDSRHAELLLQLGVRSWIAVPLQAGDKRLGAITLVCGERDFSDADLALAREIGSRAGQALENAQLYEAALAANRSKSDFLAIMSHELRTPLNAILGYTQLLLDGISGDINATQRRQLDRVNTSAAHLLQIIDDILTFASMDAGSLRVSPADVPLGELIREVAEIAEPLADTRGLAFSVHVHDPDATVVTDAARLRQILLNLLTNAAKFTAEGAISIRTAANNDALVIDVVDTGVGIPESDLATIFEPFRQVEGPLTRHEGGTGLGLAVARRMAVLLGGTLQVSSRMGAGSTFTVTLPLRSSS